MQEDRDRARRDESLQQRIDQQGAPEGVAEEGWQERAVAPAARETGGYGLPTAKGAGNVTGTGQVLEVEHPRHPLGPLEKVYAFWMAGMSCDGCSISVLGATQPPVEALLTGVVPGIPRLILHHPVLAVDAGEAFVKHFEDAWHGRLDAPYVIVLEGSVPDERLSGDGWFSAMGTGGLNEHGAGRPTKMNEWLQRLAPGAAAAIAIGTCATWGGIPAAAGNPTGSMSLMDFLGKDYRSAFGLPVINVPGCAPQGDNFTETVAAVLLFLQGLGPLPEFDELGRPAWLFGETVHRNCTRAGYYEEGVFAERYGDKQCLVEVGAINHLGGCMNVGGPCIGCTMPGFPDKFAPFYKAPPGSLISGTASRVVGGGIRRLRHISQRDRNREPLWDKQGAVPSGWARHQAEPTLAGKAMHFFYEKLQYAGGERPGRQDEEEKYRS
jgi:hydrogenase small subunit